MTDTNNNHNCNKRLRLSAPVLFVAIVAALTTLILTNDKNPGVDPNLNQETTTTTKPEEKESKMDKIYATINNEKFAIKLAENSTTSALTALLPLNLTMKDLNGNEKYANLDESLPTNTYSPHHIETGDVMLFGDDCLVIFYESLDTDYSYSKIGHIDNLPKLDDGNISIKISIE